MTTSERSNLSNQSTIAAFTILEHMATLSEPARLTDIATEVGMPRSRVYRYLQTLQFLGYVVQDPTTERYRLTLKMFHLGQAIADGTQLMTVARPVMVALRNEVRQTVTLSIPEDAGMRVIDIVRVETPVQIVTKPGAVLSLHNSAQGKIALAFGPASYRAAIEKARAGADPAFAGVDFDRLEAQIAHARKTCWAVAPEEILPGVNAVSSPIFDNENRFVATINVVGSVHDIKPEPAELYVTAVVRTARMISAELGCKEYPV